MINGPFRTRLRWMAPAASGGGSGGGGIEEAPTDGTKYGRKDGAWAAINDGIIDGEVDTHADLPVTVGTPAVGSVYNVKETTGSWIAFFTGGRKFSGLWRRISNDGDLDDWEHENHWPDVFSDDKFAIHDDGDATKRLAFALGGITTGNTRTLTVPDKSGELALLDDIPATGGSKTIASFSALSLFPGTSNYATFDTRGIMPAYEFDDGSDAGTSDETMYAVLRAKEGSDWSAGVKVYLEWMADTATTGNVMWEVAFARLNANNQDLDSLTFDTATLSSASAANGTSGKLTKPEISVAAADTDGIAAGDLFCLRITRKESNGSDTMTGDAQLVGGEVRSAA